MNIDQSKLFEEMIKDYQISIFKEMNEIILKNFDLKLCKKCGKPLFHFETKYDVCEDHITPVVIAQKRMKQEM